MLIQFHLLQNYPPSNLNRDDTGSPKDALFGGHRRGRISSQCLKRSMRRSSAFSEAFKGDGLLGERTRLLPSLIQEELQTLKVPQETLENIVARVPEIGRERKRRGEEEEEVGTEEGEAEREEAVTRQLIFLDRKELRPMAEKLLKLYTDSGAKNWKKLDIKDITKSLGKSVPRSVDIAMFGRMTTSEAFEDIQAAVQVAHAISTNALTQEFDYFTAVDDLSGQSGAGMIGDTEFNSSCYYKYLNIHYESLVQNLGGDAVVAARAAQALLEAAATAQPSGKQNSFAAFTLPEIVLVEVIEKNLPVSYANAFVTPARATHEKSLVEDSMVKLAAHLEQVEHVYGVRADRAFTALGEHELPGAQRLPSLEQLKLWLSKRLER